jgi:hypothetical protein
VLFGVGTILHVNQVYVSFRAQLTSPKFELTPEALEIKLFSEQELPWDQLAYPELTPAIRTFYQQINSQDFGIYMGEYQPENTYLERMDQ